VKRSPRAERAAGHKSSGRISASVVTTVTAVPMLDFETFTHKKLRGPKFTRISTPC
jgi:hypothetical protein